MTDTPTRGFRAIPVARGLVPRSGTLYDPASSNSVTVSASVDLEGLTPNAKDQFGKCVRRFAEDLVREVQRCETAERADGIESAEITATMVLKSDKVVRRTTVDAPEVPRVPIKKRIAQGIGVSAGIGATALAPDLHSAWQIALLAICILNVCVTSGYLYVGRGQA